VHSILILKKNKIKVRFSIVENMNNSKNNHHSLHYKRRLKSCVVRDPNGSIKTFREFYQRGGRDYEQYRLWLQTLPNPTVDSDKIKNE
jgi:hypothetical protein